GDLSGKFGAWMKGMGGKEKPVEVQLGEVGLLDADSNVMPPPDPESPDLIGYTALQRLLADPMQRGAEQIDIAAQEGATTTRYIVDGMPYSGTSLSREDTASAISYLKAAAGMNVEEKRKPQRGKMKVMYAGKKREFETLTSGSTAGETLRIAVDPKKRHDL